jgi:hypothetical protein
LIAFPAAVSVLMLAIGALKADQGEVVVPSPGEETGWRNTRESDALDIYIRRWAKEAEPMWIMARRLGGTDTYRSLCAGEWGI